MVIRNVTDQSIVTESEGHMPISFSSDAPPNCPGKPKGSEMDLVATHQRLLVAALMNTKGPVLELGVGWYSTPILHEICKAQERCLLTVDNNWDYLAQFKPLETSYHQLILVGWWGELFSTQVAETRFGIVFVDQGQPAEREYAVRRMMDNADVFVMHDTEEGFAYGYDRLLGYHRYPGSQIPPHLRDSPLGVSPYGMFQYQWTDRSQKVWTTVASNKIDVTRWGLIKLPRVEPSQEMT